MTSTEVVLNPAMKKHADNRGSDAVVDPYVMCLVAVAGGVASMVAVDQPYGICVGNQSGCRGNSSVIDAILRASRRVTGVRDASPMKLGFHTPIMVVVQGLIEHCIHHAVMADETPVLIGIVTSLDVAGLLQRPKGINTRKRAVAMISNPMLLQNRIPSVPPLRWHGWKEDTSEPIDRAPDPLPVIHDDHIRARAYFIYEDRVRHNIPGDEVGDWLRAEHELETAADRAIEAMIAGGAQERVTSGGQWQGAAR